MAVPSKIKMAARTPADRKWQTPNVSQYSHAIPHFVRIDEHFYHKTKSNGPNHVYSQIQDGRHVKHQNSST